MKKLPLILLLSILTCNPSWASVRIGAQKTMHYWANDGADKVLQEEMRARDGSVPEQKGWGTGKVINHVWDGTTINLKGAKNETTAFSLYIEADELTAGVSVTVTSLDGATPITTQTRPADDTLFDFTGRNIELFYTRYFPFIGLGGAGDWSDWYYRPGIAREIEYSGYSNQDGKSKRGTSFRDRFWANKHFPEILVPLEFYPTFTINANNTQQIWCDIYIPKTTTAGNYTGSVLVKKNGVTVKTIPIALQVYNFTLPDSFTLKAAGLDDYYSLQGRYVGHAGGAPTEGEKVVLRQFFSNSAKLWHRHHMMPLDTKSSPPLDTDAGGGTGWMDYTGLLNGTTFSAANGYDGPGKDTSVGFYMIGPYVGWGTMWGLTGTPWTEDCSTHDRDAIWAGMDGWNSVIIPNTPTVDFVVQVAEEPWQVTRDQYAHMQTYYAHFKDNPSGNRMKPYIDAVIDTAVNFGVTSVDVMDDGCAGATGTETCRKIIEEWKAAGKQVNAYNNGMNADVIGTNDFYVYWRAYRHNWPWTWYYEAEKWGRGNQGSGCSSDIFNDPDTWGYCLHRDPYLKNQWSPINVDKSSPSSGDYNGVAWYEPSIGNGAGSILDGVLVYPGTDIQSPSWAWQGNTTPTNYGVKGIFAGVDMKLIRRGLQDVDYLKMADDVNSSDVTPIEHAVIRYDDDSKFSFDPDDWETAREGLANIILNP